MTELKTACRILGIVAIGLDTSIFAAEIAVQNPRLSFPPPPVYEQKSDSITAFRFQAAAAVPYSVGDPTPEEQLYIELINRARANPPAEGVIFATTTDSDVVANLVGLGVDLALMQSQFAAIAPAPPLAPNEQLAAAARRHSADMLAASFQGHGGSDGSTTAQRAQQAGYNYSRLGENVYASARSVFHGHAGFEVDWGGPPLPTVGGMQNPPGHRNTIHNPNFREIGVGVLFGANSPAPNSQVPGSGDVGPQLVTQEFGTRLSGVTPLITGVVYFDLNANNFYDVGEGIGGARVTASGSAAEAVTARSGGYALPVAGNGAYTVTFSATGTSPFTRQVTVSDLQNVKVDWSPAFTVPRLTGSATPTINQPNPYTISPVAGANAYQWRSFQLSTPALEGAESGTANVTIQQVGAYTVIESGAKRSGTYSFHLVHPQDGIETQSILLNPSYLIRSNSVLRFASRLGLATPTQVAKVEVSTDNGTSWSTVYSQAGVGQSGQRELTFQDRTVNLSAYAGSTIRLRFSYVPSGSVFVNTDLQAGWFIDDILVENAGQVSGEQIADAPNATFNFQPQTESDFVLQGRARTGHEFLPWGEVSLVHSVPGGVTPPTLRISGLRRIGRQVEMEVEVVSGTNPASLSLESKGSLASAWAGATASVEVLPNNRFRITATSNAATAFFRVRGN